MEITVNGKPIDIEGPTVSDLLDQLKINSAGLLIERNLEIVPRWMMKSVRLCKGDRIEIIHFVGGG
jgi:thiamine biosynthesis protein ThiS